MKVNWFIPVHHLNYNHMPASVWIRCLQLLPYLEKQGIRCRINDYHRKADIAVFVRWQDQQALRTLERQRKKGARIVFDLCVNYFDVTGWFEGGYGSLPAHRAQALAMAQQAQVTTCASSFIAARALALGFTARYLPDSVDFGHFGLVKPLADFDKPTLTAIWCGNSLKARENLKIIPLLERLKLPLILLTDKPIEGYPHARFVRWTYEGFPQAILQGDICVTQRDTQNPYDQGHSIYKVGIFMAEGVPALASQLPSYKELLGAGKGGAICETPDDWQDKLQALPEQRELLKQWSLQARERMLEYSTRKVADAYKQLFENLVASTPAAPADRIPARRRASTPVKRVEGKRLAYCGRRGIGWRLERLLKLPSWGAAHFGHMLLAVRQKKGDSQ